MNILTNLTFPKAITLPRFPHISMSIVLFLGLVFIAFLLIFYIIQVNQVATANFTVSDYKKEIAKLSQENKNLEIYYSQTNSPANLEVLLRDANYVRVDKVHYIQLLEETVVVR